MADDFDRARMQMQDELLHERGFRPLRAWWALRS
jgi:hypothetical protein